MTKLLSSPVFSSYLKQEWNNLKQALVFAVKGATRVLPNLQYS